MGNLPRQGGRLADVRRRLEAQPHLVADGGGQVAQGERAGAAERAGDATARRDFAERLIRAGGAYRCYCTKEELDAQRAKLPEKQREILVLRLIVGLSADETAVAVDSTAGAVRVAQHRALTKLRGELTNHRDKTYQDQKEQR